MKDYRINIFIFILNAQNIFFAYNSNIYIIYFSINNHYHICLN